MLQLMLRITHGNPIIPDLFEVGVPISPLFNSCILLKHLFQGRNRSFDAR